MGRIPACKSGRTKIEVDEDLFDVVAKANCIDAENIAIVAYSENVFFDAESSISNRCNADCLIVIILALLAFVVLRSMRGDKHEEEEEELSVENLLQSTAEMQLEDITLKKKQRPEN